MSSYTVFEKIRQLLTLTAAQAKQGRNPNEADLSILENATVVREEGSGKILWLGKTSALPASFGMPREKVDCSGEIWMPAMVDCHTHLVFAGTREKDYAARCAGKTYQEIAQAGGGILSTLKRTRAASFEELMDLAQLEIDRFQKFGVQALEVKSGYGLNLDSEIRTLECIQALQKSNGVKLVPTFMPAHAVPPEYRDKADEYIDVICQEWIPEIAQRKLARYVDTFIEDGFFSVAQAKKVAETALSHGLAIKFHVDQFKNLGGTQLGLDMGAVSLDHLDHVSETEIAGFGKSNSVAVLLPGASLFTKTPLPPARKLIDAGARVALSTDFNPGTSPTHNLPLMVTLATSQMGMTVAEAIVGVTLNAAGAMGLPDFGTLQAGHASPVLRFKAPSYETLAYAYGELEIVALFNSCY